MAKVSQPPPTGAHPEAKNLAEIVHEAGEDHPAGLSVPSDLLGGLEQVLQLGHVRVGITVVDQLVEVFGSFPDAHLKNG